MYLRLEVYQNMEHASLCPALVKQDSVHWAKYSARRQGPRIYKTDLYHALRNTALDWLYCFM